MLNGYAGGLPAKQLLLELEYVSYIALGTNNKGVGAY